MLVPQALWRLRSASTQENASPTWPSSTRAVWTVSTRRNSTAGFMAATLVRTFVLTTVFRCPTTNPNFSLQKSCYPCGKRIGITWTRLILRHFSSVRPYNAPDSRAWNATSSLSHRSINVVGYRGLKDFVPRMVEQPLWRWVGLHRKDGIHPAHANS